MKVAIVHDWLTGMRGGEYVLEVFCDLFPQADLFTLIHRKGSVSERIESLPIRTSFLERIPGAKKRYRRFLPLMPAAIERFDLTPYDFVLSSSHCVAKGVVTRPGTLHVCYCHAPMRYAWESHHRYFGDDRLGFMQRWLLPPIFTYLRMWDAVSANRVDRFIANSEAVRRRIRKYYGRDSAVIHPPVDTERFRASEGGDYYLVVSAFAPYKRIDLAINAAGRLGRPLKIVGTGQDEGRLRKLAASIPGSRIEFLGWQPAGELVKLIEGCRALLFPGEEDFGIVPVEAMSAGRPVIALAKGGALETVVGLGDPGRASPTGVFFPEETAESLAEGIQAFEAVEADFDAPAIRAHALQFDAAVFRAAVEEFMREAVSTFQGNSAKRPGRVAP
jgi:glycosyltransferase involved in cell wall biosynthesis